MVQFGPPKVNADSPRTSVSMNQRQDYNFNKFPGALGATNWRIWMPGDDPGEL